MPFRPKQLNEKRNKFHKGDILIGEPYGGLKHPVYGKIEHVYQNSVLFEITKYQPVDKTIVSEMNNRAVESMDSIEIIKKAAEENTKPDEKDQN